MPEGCDIETPAVVACTRQILFEMARHLDVAALGPSVRRSDPRIWSSGRRVRFSPLGGHARPDLLIGYRVHSWLAGSGKKSHARRQSAGPFDVEPNGRVPAPSAASDATLACRRYGDRRESRMCRSSSGSVPQWLRSSRSRLPERRQSSACSTRYSDDFSVHACPPGRTSCCRYAAEGADV